MNYADELWAELGIEPTDDAAAIKRAYAHKLKQIDASEDPNAFMRLRQAYDFLRGGDDVPIQFFLAPQLTPDAAPQGATEIEPTSPPSSNPAPESATTPPIEDPLVELRALLDQNKEREAIESFDQILRGARFDNIEERAALELALLEELENRVPIPSVFGEHLYRFYDWSHLRHGPQAYLNARFEELRQRLDVGAPAPVIPTARPEKKGSGYTPGLGIAVIAALFFLRICMGGQVCDRGRQPPIPDRVRQSIIEMEQRRALREGSPPPAAAPPARPSPSAPAGERNRGPAQQQTQGSDGWSTPNAERGPVDDLRQRQPEMPGSWR